MRSKWRNRALNVLLLLGSAMVSMLLIEGLLAFVLRHPGLLAGQDGSGGRMLEIARDYYMNRDRRIVQLSGDCAIYDPELTYTLKRSSSCTISSREHRVVYNSNREGVRDDDPSLVDPKIVVIGDSHAMGWGVPASEAFPDLLQRDLRVSVLNAAIPSYGTVREFLLLKRLHLQSFSTLVIQYCDNDFSENQSLTPAGTLPITSEEQYRKQAAKHLAQTGYWPLKHLFYLLRLTKFSAPGERKAKPDTNNDEARAFLEVLLLNRTLIEGKTVMVVELNENNQNDSRFTGSVSSLLGTERYSSIRPWIHVLDVSKVLSARDYYVLDDHMTARGHAQVARLLEAEYSRHFAVLP